MKVGEYIWNSGRFPSIEKRPSIEIKAYTNNIQNMSADSIRYLKWELQCCHF
jgi:hypothetical protein